MGITGCGRKTSVIDCSVEDRIEGSVVDTTVKLLSSSLPSVAMEESAQFSRAPLKYEFWNEYFYKSLTAH